MTDKADEPCTVTVKTADAKQGTADANGQPDTYTYGAGEEIVLRAYPADGYAVDYWTDTYGRRVPQAWADANFLRFYAPESGTYTVHFKQAQPNAIEAVGIDNAPSATVCDLQGRKVNNKRHLHSGVYIVNRHKQIVK